MRQEIELRVLSSVAGFDPKEWNALTGANPTVSHEYLLALEETRCASSETGWSPRFIGAFAGKKLVGAIPLYFKSHSYGEFVFDQAWADAYEQNGLEYYPKLVSSVPFTPVSGPRAMAESEGLQKILIRAAVQLAEAAGASSLHILFPTEAAAKEMKDLGLMLRNTVQFHWRNAGFKSFSDFLAGMRHDKRKKILQERRKLKEANVTYEQIRGGEATEEDWKFFYTCYLHTHHLYRSPAPLTLEFFLQLGRTMPGSILLIFASKNGKRMAAAFDLFNSTHFFGRSWGALEYIPGLHFEVCYYQAIEFCIANDISIFEGGAQGEHKLARGLLPVTTWSAHWLAHPEFAAAVDDFLKRETGSIVQYVNELNESNPFRA